MKSAQCTKHFQVVLTTTKKGVVHEQISKIITCDMALPVSYCMDTKVPLQDIERRSSKEVERCIRSFREYCKGEVVELNVQDDHVHLLVMVPPKK